ncbi:MAG: 1-deoxy-D-xylulose-5-phosphate reductoisomerase [Candidatus Aegiribacteria sp.]|nr:1-deoxy-D-xylulose-5-phosphate reductoisomerase [Candidatus Aegiribacteria sp.]
MSIRRVAVLGSTGSVGKQALEIIDARPDLELYSILCRRNIDLLQHQKEKFQPSISAIVSPEVDIPSDIIKGAGVLDQAVEGADIVLNAIVGSAGLRASILCQELDIPLALANKESLVIGGELLRDHLKAGKVIPVDSEHSTIKRCLQSEKRPVRGITLTASGGSVLLMPIDEIRTAGPERILKHPTWEMGARITVDSATMVNKAYEVIEAGWLFENIPVEVVIHPQSIVHSFIRLEDGSWKALLGQPDMKIPIQFALEWPDRELDVIAGDKPFDWGTLAFREMDEERYPAFSTVVQTGIDGKTFPAVANAADEVAVQAFLDGRILFGNIAEIIDEVLSLHRSYHIRSLEDVLEADRNARTVAAGIVSKLC